jgi:hypothetical protein
VIVQLQVTIEMTDQQVHDYAEEYLLEESKVRKDVADYLREDLKNAVPSNTFWTASVK